MPGIYTANPTTHAIQTTLECKLGNIIYCQVPAVLLLVILHIHLWNVSFGGAGHFIMLQFGLIKLAYSTLSIMSTNWDQFVTLQLVVFVTQFSLYHSIITDKPHAEFPMLRHVAVSVCNQGSLILLQIRMMCIIKDKGRKLDWHQFQYLYDWFNH